MRELPFAARTSVRVFGLKLALLAAIFVHAFYRFTWRLRQYSFGAILAGGAPDARLFAGAGCRPADGTRLATFKGGALGAALALSDQPMADREARALVRA